MTIEIKTEYIKLVQILKLSNIISQGSDFSAFINENKVIHKGINVTEKGKKIYKGESITINQKDIINVV